MFNALRKRVSAPLVISMIALFAALGGAAVALPGKNSVDSGDVKKNSLKSGDIKNDGVTGVDVKESTLDIPAAALPAGAGSTYGVTVSSGGAVQTTTLPGVTVTPAGGGVYTLVFPRNLNGCVPVASDEQPLIVAFRAHVANNNQVFIGASDNNNTDFSVVVVCPS